MLENSLKYIIAIVFISTATSLPQTERYTKGAENGYAWLSMEDPNLMYNTSKENYLSSILDRFRVTGATYPEIESLSCREDIKKLFAEGKSDEFSLEDVANEIERFYLQKENLVIPIIFAYCHTIKKFSGTNEKDLKVYLKDVLKFCNE